MDTDISKLKLEDLGLLASKTKTDVEQNFISSDTELSEGFKASFRNNAEKAKNQISYFQTNALIITSGGLKIFLPNQWFILASYAMNFLAEIIRYRELVEDAFDAYSDEFKDSSGKILERKEIYAKLKKDKNKNKESDKEVVSIFRGVIYKYLLDQNQSSTLAEENATLLLKFVTDLDWWLGGKGIDRSNDYYVSPVLGVLDLVNASQSYVANIAYAYVTDENLRKEVNTMMQSKTIISENNYRPLIFNTSLKIDQPYNKIIFGAPGTGKSYQLEEERRAILKGDTIGGYERVTFHPDYTYSQFVGAYKPVSEGKDIYYKFIPGPFMRIYTDALLNARTDYPEPFILVVEEINRADVAAVFGDIFQLLDRDENGVSQYEIEASEDIRKYLVERLGGQAEFYKTLKIPNNLFIWASMNSADQGVFPMDTAFKRRWTFDYLGIDDNDSGIRGKTVVLGNKKIEWNKLRKAINKYLSRQKINEDKLLGPYFLSKSIVVPKNGNEIDHDKFVDAFENKVLMYLFEDAAKQRRTALFRGCGESANRYSEICRLFEEKGIEIFDPEIQQDTEASEVLEG